MQGKAKATSSKPTGSFVGVGRRHLRPGKCIPGLAKTSPSTNHTEMCIDRCRGGAAGHRTYGSKPWSGSLPGRHQLLRRGEMSGISTARTPGLKRRLDDWTNMTRRTRWEWVRFSHTCAGGEVPESPPLYASSETNTNIQY